MRALHHSRGQVPCHVSEALCHCANALPEGPALRVFPFDCYKVEQSMRDRAWHRATVSRRDELELKRRLKQSDPRGAVILSGSHEPGQ